MINVNFNMGVDPNILYTIKGNIVKGCNEFIYNYNGKMLWDIIYNNNLKINNTENYPFTLQYYDGEKFDAVDVNIWVSNKDKLCNNIKIEKNI